MPSADTSTLSLDAVRERYRLERERRMPAAGERLYRDVQDGFAHLAADPYGVAPSREPLTDEVEVLVVGAGFGGLLCAARMVQAGVKTVRLVEAGSDVGGAWYWNRYPGAACDVESYIYLPLLEETGYMPVERYSKAAEIRDHTRRIADHFGLYEHAVFSTQVTALDWDEATKRWTVETDRGDAMRAKYVVLTTGPLNKPKLPDIPGITSFKGHTFHTSRWDYAYTGGSATEPLEGLRDKAVGIIGTGATAIQCVPRLAASARQLYVFQRTPSYVAARDNAATDPEWVKTLEPGWQQRRMENFTAQFTGIVDEEDMVRDGWTVLARNLRERLMADPKQDIAAALDEEDMKLMARGRERVAEIVRDPVRAEALQAWFSVYCKRPCFHDEYLQAFNNPNVELVDTKGRGVEAITERGCVVDGVEYPLDCLIFATGFETSGDFTTRSGFVMRGREGRTLSDKWSSGISTLHGLQSRGFPNVFIISQTQSGMSVNFPHMLNEQSKHAAHIVGHCLAQDVATVEPAEHAEREWVDTIVKMAMGRAQAVQQCTPGYYNNEGRPSPTGATASPYGAGPVAFLEVLREWRARGDLAGLELDGCELSAREAREA